MRGRQLPFPGRAAAVGHEQANPSQTLPLRILPSHARRPELVNSLITKFLKTHEARLGSRL